MPAPSGTVVGLRDQFHDASPEHQASLGQYREVAAGLGHVLDDVRAEQDRALARELGEQGAEADPLLGVPAAGRFVHDQQPGVGEQCLGDAGPAQHAAGEALEPAVGVLGERDHLE
ncbi:hypothetical protein AB0K21_41755 [Streptosporangium sp. NPDC049248]|uniref:hypothetical protein n=1 Tax=Streptosporangium sp. NPDC049248 TaxID=3155651 RepID=UPI0034125931